MLTINYDPATANHASPKATLGAIYWHEGKAYKYVQFIDDVTYALGHVCLWANDSGTAVTNDKDGTSIADTDPTAGICLRAMTADYYGYIQVSGTAEVLGDTNVAAAEYVKSHTVDGAAIVMGDTYEELAFGIALEADDLTTVLFTCALKGLL